RDSRYGDDQYSDDQYSEERPNQGHFVVASQVDVHARRITWLDPEDGWHEASWEDFDRLWSGVVLLATPGDKPLDARRAGRAWIVATLKRIPWSLPVWLAAFLLPWFTQLGGNAEKVWFVLKIIGLFFCVVLAFHGKGLGRGLCPTGKHVNCASVLNSPAARLFGMVPLADAGVVYFLWGILVFLSGYIQPYANVEQGLTTLAWVGSAAMVYALFLFFYQALKLRTWCLLCLAVQAVIMFEFVVSFDRAMGDEWHWPGSTLLFALPLALAIWMLLRPMIESQLEIGSVRRIIRRLRGDPNMIDGVLAGEPVAPEYAGPADIRLGAANPRYELVVVSHPDCGYCLALHREILAMMPNFKDMLSIKFRFLVKDPTVPAYARALVPLSLWGQDRHAEAIGAFEECFASRVPATHAMSAQDIVSASNVLDTQTEWALRAGCVGTPTLFLNARKLPSHITLKHLRMYLRRRRRSPHSLGASVAGS
ncbi:MAG: vitamin K epoxide reductase family protein, partial [Burkholderiales bacterium]